MEWKYTVACVAFLFLTVSAAPCAARDILGRFTEASGAPGDTGVAVSLEVEDATGIAGISLTVNYPDKVLAIPSPDRVVRTDLTADFYLVANTGVPGQVRVSLFSPTGIPSGKGALVTFLFDVKGGAAPNRYGAFSPLRTEFRDIGAEMLTVPKMPEVGRFTVVDTTLATAPPEVDFTAEPRSGPAPLTVRFTDGSRNRPRSWAWDFGDGKSSVEQNPTHTYGTPGRYAVTLRAVNSAGVDTEFRAGYITVRARETADAPVADFTAEPRSGAAPLTVRFTDGSRNGPTSWSWNFGDGTGAAEQNPSHTYEQPGTYTVAMTAANSGGSDSKVRQGLIEVVSPTRVTVELTADPGAIPDDGSATATLRARLADAEGRLAEDDYATAVTFEILGGGAGGAGSLSDARVTVSGGIAETMLSGSLPGLLRVHAGVAGAEGDTVSVTVTASGGLPAGPGGPPPAVEAGPGEIATVAGGYLGDGAAATRASLNGPSDLFVDGAGNVYIADTDNDRVRRIDPPGTIATVAGGGAIEWPPYGDGGPATEARLRRPVAVFADGSGNLYIAEASKVRRVDASGTITTVAGGGGSKEDGVPATQAQVSTGHGGLCVDSAGNLYITDRSNHRVRRVDASGTITTVAGNGTSGFSGDGGPATDAQLNQPSGIFADGSGNLYIADRLRVRRVDASGTITTVAGNGARSPRGDGVPATDAAVAPVAVFVDGSGDLYISDNSANRIWRVDASGTITTAAGGGRDASADAPATEAALLNPDGIFVDGAGEIYIVERTGNRIRKVNASGRLDMVAGGFLGDGNPALQSVLVQPQGVVADAAGNLYISDTGHHRVRRVDALSGTITTVAGNGTKGLSGDGGAAIEASLRDPGGLAVDGRGDLYIADRSSMAVRKVDASGKISTVAGGQFSGPPGDGGPATEAYVGASDVFVDSSGNLYIADARNHRVRKVDASGTITTAAGNGNRDFSGDGGAAADASLNQPSGVFVDGSGNLYIADAGNNRIRRIDPSGAISTVAGGGTAGWPDYGDGGTATDAALSFPVDVLLDSSGNLFIAEANSGRIRRVDASGTIATVAGNGSRGFSGDGGPAIDASLARPSAIAVDASGAIYVADTGNHRVRRVEPGEPAPVILTLSVSADRDTIVADALDAAAIQVRIVDGDGDLQGDDNTTAVRFAIASGSGRLSASQATASGGIATVRLTSDTPGAIGVQAGAEGMAPVTVSVVARARAQEPDPGEDEAPQPSGTPPTTFDGWKESPFAADLDGDGQIAFSDYIRFLQQPGGGDPSPGGGQPAPSRTIELTVEPDTVTTNGFDVATIRARILGANGVLQSDDDTTAVTFRVIERMGEIPLVEEMEATARGGVAEITKADDRARILKVEAETPGAEVATASLVVLQPFRRVELTVDRDTIAADGIESATIQARILDMEGNLLSGDNSTVFVFSSPWGGGRLSAGEARAAAGVATVTVAGKVPGVAVRVEAVAQWADRDAIAVWAEPVEAPLIATTVAGTGISESTGDGGPATLAGLQAPRSIFVAGSGDIYITQPRRIRKVDRRSGTISTSVGNGEYGFSGDGGPATDANLSLPSTVYVDASGNAYLSDDANNRIRRVDGRTGTIATVAGNGTRGFSGDGGPATDASLDTPGGVSVDGSGNIYILDSGNRRIRKVDAATGTIATVVGNGDWPSATHYGDGTISFPDSGDGVSATAVAATPTHLFVDASGNIYFAERDVRRIRKVDAGTGLITTVAGSGKPGFSGDGGPATDASLDGPHGIFADGSGNVYIADKYNHRIRKVDAETGVIITIAGSGTAGFSGDGGPALEMQLDHPSDVFLDPQGSIYILDGDPPSSRTDLSSGTVETFEKAPRVRKLGRPSSTPPVVQTEVPAPSADFDGDGEVGFSDFIQFARVFGAKEGDGKYRRKYDLDESSDIGFPDFIRFARDFGKKADEIGASKPAGALLSGANAGAGLSLASDSGEASDEAVLVVRLTEAVAVSGYSLRISYSASALEFAGAVGASGSLFAGGPGAQEVALQAPSGAGEVLLADVLRPGAAVEGEGDLVRLRFRVLDAALPGRVEIVEAHVSDPFGRIDEIAGARLDRARALPIAYELSQNFPNPFNPETQIAYQLPEAGAVSLVIYNLLGQRVRTLVSARQEAGFYRVVWDSRDAAGRPVSSGVYLYRLVSGRFVQTRRMLLLK